MAESQIHGNWFGNGLGILNKEVHITWVHLDVVLFLELVNGYY